jgi:hypothetical protein
MVRWKLFGVANASAEEKKGEQGSGSDDLEAHEKRPAKWSLGILNDKQTDEVPGMPNPSSLST